MFVWVQVLRGLAASMVVVHHYLAAQAERGADLAHWWLEFGGSGVDIFFVISGFIMMITQSDSGRGGTHEFSAKRFLIRRVIRIVPLYWVLTALAFGMASLAGGAVNTHISGEKFLMSMLFLPYSEQPLSMADMAHAAYVIPMSWTLTYEWFFYLVFSLALAFGLRLFARLRFIALCFAVLVAVGLVFQPQALLLQIVTSPLLFEFLLGSLIAVLYLRGWRIQPVYAVLLAVIALAVLVNLMHEGVFGRTLIWGLAAFGLVLAAVLNGREREQPFVIRPFSRLGDISYSLYLSHFFTLALFVRIQERVPLLDDGFGLPALLGFVFLNIFVAELCFRFIEEPARRYFAGPNFAWLRAKRVSGS